MQFSLDEMNRRHTAIRALLESEDLDALVIYGAGRYQADILWASDWPGGREAYIVFEPSGAATLLLQFFNHLDTARRLSRIPDVGWAGPVNARTLGDRLARIGKLRRVGVAGSLPVYPYKGVVDRFPGVQWVFMGQADQALRLI